MRRFIGKFNQRIKSGIRKLPRESYGDIEYLRLFFGVTRESQTRKGERSKCFNLLSNEDRPEINMREIVHIQAGQCGNQIGAKVSSLSMITIIFISLFVLLNLIFKIQCM